MRRTLILFGAGLIVASVGCKKKPAKDKDTKDPAEKTMATMGAAMAAKGDKRPTKEQATAWAKEVFGLMAKGKHAAAVKRFGPQLAEALPQSKLEVMWKQMTTQLGAHQGIEVQKAGPVGPKGFGLKLGLKFQKMTITAQVAFDPQGTMFAFVIRNPKPKFPPWKPPAYVKKDSFTEEAVTVGSGELALPGTLTLPKTPKGRLRAVVLVHGSGPQDRDETIGPNKVFKDLAWGLASRGIAVLRYEKVTKAHPGKVMKTWGNKVTVDMETTNDALLAVALLRKHRRIDPKKVIYCGHSQGAWVAPRAGKKDPQLAGLIVLAGPTRPMEDVGLAQYEYIAGAGGPQAKAMKAQLAAMRKAVALVKSPKLSLKTPKGQLPLSIPASFWLDARNYQPAKMARGLKMPILVLQGEADYQVNMKDFAGWKKGLKGKKNATLKSYPRLGHTFIDLQKKMAMPLDYFKVTGHVTLQVITDIAKWVKGL